MADHKHIKMLVYRVDGERHCRVRGRGKNVRERCCLDNVGSVSAACALGVVGVNSSAVYCGEGILDKTAFVERVGVDRDLNVVFIRNGKSLVDNGRSCAPVLVYFQAASTCFDLLGEGLDACTVALAEIAEVHRVFFRSLEHFFNVEFSGRASGSVRAVGRTRTAAYHRCDARIKRSFDLRRADKVDMRVDTACGEDKSLACDSFGRCAENERGRNAVHNVGVSCLADAADLSVLYADISLVDAR